MPVSYDLPMHGQRNIKNCKEKVLQDVRVYVNLLPPSVGKDEIVHKINKIITTNFKSLEK